jgi:tripartite ATP-independent transporter DctP family solute receptor
MKRKNRLTRRAFVGSTALSVVALAACGRRAAAPEFVFTQFHNQTAESTLHRRLVEMWDAVGSETSGRVTTEVVPQNDQIAGSDPEALQMLARGEIQFFTLMGGILGNVVPVAEVQSVPFAFRSASHAHEALDGALGEYLREEMAAKGIVGFPVGAFDNGMRQIGCRLRPIRVPGDLTGIRMRVPAGQIFADTFAALGAEPVTINSSGIYEALRTGAVDAQENPLAYMEQFRHQEVTRYVSMTNHMWSGFNLLGHLPTWQRLPADIRDVITRNAAIYVRLQREDQQAANDAARAVLEDDGLIFNDTDPAPFRARLSGVYAAWKERLGTRCWSLLEEAAGRLA